MTVSTLVATSDGVRLEQPLNASVMFIDWQIDDPDYSTCSLFDGLDIIDCKLVFFDPLQFAISNGLVLPDANIANMSYVSLDEKDFLRYLAKAKKATETLQRFLENGGLFIIRSNIPKSSIKVRKRSVTGTMKYTDSVISTFFWLEDILGVYSLTYCQAKTVKYIQKKNPLENVFGKVGVQCVQTLNSTGRGIHEIIATRGSSSKSAAISKLSFANVPGQVFLVPKFIVGEEHKQLVKAFHQISVNAELGLLRPIWLDYYEKQVQDCSPQRPLIDSVELEIEAMKKQLASLLHKQEVYDGLIDLLYQSDKELETAARTSMGILGFECLYSSSEGETPAFEVYPADDKSVRFMVRVVHTESGPILADEVAALSTAISGRTKAIKAKGILVGNAACDVHPEQREEWFDEASIEDAKRQNICLMPSLSLFIIVCYLMSRNDDENIDLIKTSLIQDITKCDSVFIINQKKYGI